MSVNIIYIFSPRFDKMAQMESEILCLTFKAAMVNIFTLTMGHSAVCNALNVVDLLFLFQCHCSHEKLDISCLNSSAPQTPLCLSKLEK